eukprot:CAMPEP_0168338624 /NCGR_PEP_ID=MMETSP0213-20121227/12957_1 /TAXON_ID=151035 /ORGANISM="Euplotes harpa, Strain FSP1.4" /LENGTH=203 /DNA_ID=CAMNT_0008344461 /DNA_START=66 /DNA_END=677 /DNA_ORIENTATION=-
MIKKVKVSSYENLTASISELFKLPLARFEVVYFKDGGEEGSVTDDQSLLAAVKHFNDKIPKFLIKPSDLNDHERMNSDEEFSDSDIDLNKVIPLGKSDAGDSSSYGSAELQARAPLVKQDDVAHPKEESQKYDRVNSDAAKRAGTEVQKVQTGFLMTNPSQSSSYRPSKGTEAEQSAVEQLMNQATLMARKELKELIPKIIKE